MEAEERSEANFKVKINQSAKGFNYFEVVVRADNKEDLKIRLDEAVKIAEIKCRELNNPNEVNK